MYIVYSSQGYMVYFRKASSLASLVPQVKRSTPTLFTIIQIAVMFKLITRKKILLNQILSCNWYDLLCYLCQYNLKNVTCKKEVNIDDGDKYSPHLCLCTNVISTLGLFLSINTNINRGNRERLPSQGQGLGSELGRTGKPYWRRRLGTIYLLVPTSLDQMLLILQGYEAKCAELSPTVSDPWVKGWVTYHNSLESPKDYKVI